MLEGQLPPTKSHDSFTPKGTDKADILRPFTPAENARWESSKRIPYVPILSTVNNIKIAITGEDLNGYYQNEGQVKDAKENMVVDSALVVAGAGLKLADDAAKLMDDAIEGGSEAISSYKYDLLKKDLKYTEKYGTDARKVLPDERIRYYGEIEPASKPGEMIGRRVVQELDPSTGNIRTWQETLDDSLRIRQVRPQMGPSKTHYMFDKNGKYTGKW